ncbi:hypothetical protein Ga0074812_104245 [Parafrankia irregularis]|uniref:Uncharacterized protein n=1 Tax=Parafrankia irregularis TaxID=795642 RepID=A0A0S4QK54_9ACTN|nr:MULTISPECIES: hypothetical protein [Parafrankia]MBE3203963.1 hypothetical protein [Parafrankia sp. CH37]CUU55164.1 hypothetical protein Ga0074812_104245 [Parafrankia irregularis]
MAAVTLARIERGDGAPVSAARPWGASGHGGALLSAQEQGEVRAHDPILPYPRTAIVRATRADG